MLMDVANQAIFAHTFCKYLVDVAYLSGVFLSCRVSSGY